MTATQHLMAGATLHVALTTPSTCDEITSRSTKLGVDDEIQYEVDGEVGQQEKVSE